MDYQHKPVMIKEVMEILNPKPGENFIDCTLGGAGYTLELAKRVGDKGKILAIDLDEAAIKNAQSKIEILKLKNIILHHGNFRDLADITAKECRGMKFNGIVMDLGLSSAQLADKSRGFSFQDEARLNMSFNQTVENDKNAEYILNNYSQQELEKIIKEYGEERFAKRIVQKIVEYRQNQPIKTTEQLLEVIKQVVPKKFQHGHLHPATRTFQALRIAVNDELENLKVVLPPAVELLSSGGKIAIVSFHSLEDRIVKQYFKQEARDCLCPKTYPACRCQHLARLKILTKHVLRPSEEEILKNHRARSAKLRAAQKI